MEDLEEAVKTKCNTIAVTLADYSDLAMYLNNLESSLRNQYFRTRSTKNPEELEDFKQALYVF